MARRTDGGHPIGRMADIPPPVPFEVALRRALADLVDPVALRKSPLVERLGLAEHPNPASALRTEIVPSRRSGRRSAGAATLLSDLPSATRSNTRRMSTNLNQPPPLAPGTGGSDPRWPNISSTDTGWPRTTMRLGRCQSRR